MKKVTFFLIFALITVLFCENLSAQTYRRVRVSFLERPSIEGRNAYIDNEKLTLTRNSMQITYPLEEVFYVQAKRGLAGTYALGFGGGCLALGLISTLTYSDDEFEQSELFLGSILWAGIFAGVGALIGSLSDPWTEVYRNRPQSSLLHERINVSFSSGKHAPVSIGLVYRFN